VTGGYVTTVQGGLGYTPDAHHDQTRLVCSYGPDPT